MNKVIIAGGSGFLGNALTEHFLKNNYEVIILSRSRESNSSFLKEVLWDGVNIGEWTEHLENSDLLINLCGKSVDCRYNKRNKTEIFTSRINSTNAIGKAIQGLKNPPPLWINASSATIYPHSEKDCKTEEDEIGTGFSVDVCKAWEKSFFQFETQNTRKVAIRASMVFGQDGSVYKTLRNLSLKGLGGTQGSGRQFVSWIHIEDSINIIDFISANDDLKGCVNVCSPNPKTNKEFNEVLRQSLGVKFHFPIKKWMIHLGAFFMKTEPELVLKSRRVVPKKLLDSGYDFKFPELNIAFDNLSSRK